MVVEVVVVRIVVLYTTELIIQQKIFLETKRFRI
jgi:hypothetical protein